METYRLETLLASGSMRFRRQDEVEEALRQVCRDHADVACCQDLGLSEEGHPLLGFVLGKGPRKISLLAGAHADEPVGPETLRTLLLEALGKRDNLTAFFEENTLVIVPHINPDGEARNQTWIRQWPDVGAFLAHVVRELPGRDLEFGFPIMRQENQHVATFLKAHGPMDLHMSLHGMAFSEGAMLLIERHWAGYTSALQTEFAAAAKAEGLGLHDHNRKGEKGFFYIQPGFGTTPEGAAMRHHFRVAGDEAMASRFFESSMEYVRTLGGNPLCVVTELPLFLVAGDDPREAGVPSAYLALQESLPQARMQAIQGKDLSAWITTHRVEPLPLAKAIRIQLRTIDLAIAQCQTPR